MAATAQGQFTIVDYNDAITLSGYLASSVQKNQRYLTDSTNYLPDWSTTHPVITPHLFKAGSTDDLLTKGTNIKSIEWYANNTSIEEINEWSKKYGYISGHNLDKYQLQIKTNLMSQTDTGLEIRCDITYHDSTSGLDIVHSLSISYSLVRDGGGIVAIELTTPEGEVFKNNQIEFLRVIGKLWRGSEVDTDNITYNWAYNDENVTANTIFGPGWQTIPSEGISNKFVFPESNNHGILKVLPDAVPGLLTIQCAIIDTDNNNTSYIDGVTLVDRSDPLEVIIVSTGGNIFKNGSGTDIQLTAKVYQGGEEIDADGNKCNYNWAHYDANGQLEDASNNLNSETGKSITVKPEHVTGKATFWCTVTYPKTTTSST